MKTKTLFNRFNTTFASVFLMTMFSGCLERREPIKKETGYVVEKQYFPDTRQTVLGTGLSTSGNVVITTHDIGADEKYVVIFKCEHGVLFSINRAELYGRLNKGDTVTIDYYEMINGEGEVKDFDFIDAYVR